MRYSTTSKGKRPDVYQIITDKVVTLLEQGTVPWQKPWKGGAAGAPKNAVSKKPYRGVNVFMLAVTAEFAGYDSPYWITYKQAQELGGNVRKGEKATLVVFWKFIDKETTDETGKKHVEQIPFLRYYNVFNACQCENITIPDAPIDETPDLDFSPIEVCENVIGNFAKSPPIYHEGSGNRAYYKPTADEVYMPKRENFHSVAEYYSVLFHEVTHSTGHKSRLDRHKDDQAWAPFGSCDYSKEELVAEMGAAFLCGMCDIENETIDSSAAYIEGWLRKLKNDKKLVVHAAAQAQKATDYILGK